MSTARRADCPNLPSSPAPPVPSSLLQSACSYTIRGCLLSWTRKRPIGRRYLHPFYDLVATVAIVICGVRCFLSVALLVFEPSVP